MEYYLKKFVKKSIEKILFKKRGVVQYYNDPGKKEIFDMVKQIKREVNFKLSVGEAYQLAMVVIATKKIEGDIAEVGTYQGGSAKVICETKEQKHLYIFDTFEGLPEPGSKDDTSRFSYRQYATPFDSVKQYVGDYSNVHLEKGRFPETGESIRDHTFSLVHLDVDLYESTRAGLEFFYPRMNPGGIIISHDYSYVEGVRDAFNEFFRGKPEAVIELHDSQCMVVKQ